MQLLGIIHGHPSRRNEQISSRHQFWQRSHLGQYFLSLAVQILVKSRKHSPKQHGGCVLCLFLGKMLEKRTILWCGNHFGDQNCLVFSTKKMPCCRNGLNQSKFKPKRSVRRIPHLERQKRKPSGSSIGRRTSHGNEGGGFERLNNDGAGCGGSKLLSKQVDISDIFATLGTRFAAPTSNQ